MTLEQRIELHDQWLLSMESNQSRMAADLAALSRKQDQLTDIVVTLAQNQGALFTAMGSLTTNVDRLATDLDSLSNSVQAVADSVQAVADSVQAIADSVQAVTDSVQALADQQRKLEETLERYIRFQGNGRQEN